MKQICDYTGFVVDRPVAILAPKTTAQIQDLLRTNPGHIVVGGARKSHGGHLWFSKPHTYLDTSNLNFIGKLENNVLSVAAGCTWEQIQNYIHPLGLSPICQQSSNDFSIGGSIAGNAHGRDIHNSTIETSVEWIDMVMADGTLTRASRSKNSSLFWNMFGSQGMLSLIVGAGLRLTSNNLMEQKCYVLKSTELNNWFDTNNHSFTFFIARPSVGHGLSRCLVTTWADTGQLGGEPLGTEKNWKRDKFIFWLSSKSNFLMCIRWNLEKATQKHTVISRINAMRPPTVPLKMFATKSKRFGYAVQEIFIPKHNLIKALDAINGLGKYPAGIALVGVTIRHIGTQSAKMGYSRTGERWAIMLYWKVPKNQLGMGWHAWLQSSLYDLCVVLNGTIYLSYASLQSPEAILMMYPHLSNILRLKHTHDPSNIFISDFTAKLLCLSFNHES